ncbi:AAA family ATPase [Geobacter sp. FeAm09]|nr:AAA family ATPase [Geobacter sp. FeAm09]
MANQGNNTRIYAVCGKGGVGKTAFTAMLTRALLDSGRAGRLLVIDADPAQGVTNALGMQVEKTMGQVRESIITAARDGRTSELAEITNAIDYLVMEALVESDSLALLAMGRTESLGCFCPVNDLLRDAVTAVAGKFDTILIDGEAGLEQINRQVVEALDCLIMMTDSSARGLRTVAILKEMIEEKKVIRCNRTGVVFNRGDIDENYLAQAAVKVGVNVFGFVPQDPNVADYDLVGRPLLELPSDSEALAAVRRIAAILEP